MYCTNCGKQLEPNEKYCPYCGIRQQERINIHQSGIKEDKPGMLVNLLCFFIPPAAIFLCLIWLRVFPSKSKSCAIYGISGFIFRIIIAFIFVFSLIL